MRKEEEGAGWRRKQYTLHQQHAPLPLPLPVPTSHVRRTVPCTAPPLHHGLDREGRDSVTRRDRVDSNSTLCGHSVLTVRAFVHWIFRTDDAGPDRAPVGADGAARTGQTPEGAGTAEKC